MREFLQIHAGKHDEIDIEYYDLFSKILGSCIERANNKEIPSD
jgi:hypothetical protein